MDHIFRIRTEIRKSGETVQDQTLFKGDMIISVDVPVTIEGVQIELTERVKGKMVSQTNVIHQQTLTSSLQVFQVGEEYHFPFEMMLDKNIDSYKGKNFSIFYEFEVEIDIEKESYNDLDKSILKDIKSFFTGERNYKYSENIPFAQSRTHYAVIESTEDFSLKNNSNFMIVVGLLTALIGALIFPFDRIFGGFLGFIIGLGLGRLLQKAFSSSNVGQINVAIQNKDKEEFLAFTQSINNWKNIRSADLHYEIVEEVVDKRGTSTSTYTETLYASRVQPLTIQEVTTEAIFPFPTKYIPIIHKKDANIKWLLFLDVKTKQGLSMDFKREFMVRNM